MTTLRLSQPSPSPYPHLAGKSVLVTGGLGFIGSSLAINLVQAGAKVHVLDALIPEYGGNYFNIESVADQVHVTIGDIRDVALMEEVVRGHHIVFHCAAQVSHVKSLTDPFPDIDINIKGTAILLEALRRQNPNAMVVKLGTRGQYGPAATLPVAETAPMSPRGIYELSLQSSEQLLSIYHAVHGIPVILLRLTNIYGPRAQMKHSRFGVANWFVRLAMEDRRIPVFGDGSIKRDFLYIDDCIDGILRLTGCPAAIGEVFNLGDDRPSNFLELTRVIVEEAGTGSWGFEEFSRERKLQEPGDFYSCIDKIEKFVGWRPATPLRDGVRQTVQFYRRHASQYWERPAMAA